MYSNLIRYVFALTSFSPVLLISWIVNTLLDRKKLSFYFALGNVEAFREGAIDLSQRHWHLFLFILIVVGSNFMMKGAVKSLPSWNIELKSFKAADPNFATVLISYILPWAKFALGNEMDIIYLLVFLVICLVYAFIVKDTSHFNINVRLFLGYRHYEVQSKGETTFLMLSRKKIVNKNEVKSYISLTDHMIINAS